MEAILHAEFRQYFVAAVGVFPWTTSQHCTLGINKLARDASIDIIIIP